VLRKLFDMNFSVSYKFIIYFSKFNGGYEGKADAFPLIMDGRTEFRKKPTSP